MKTVLRTILTAIAFLAIVSSCKKDNGRDRETGRSIGFLSIYDTPERLVAEGDQEEECYTKLTEELGIYPLGYWDSQIWWLNQLNIWEARQGPTDFKGTLLCIGNGGCEFSMKNKDGTPDKSAHPKNNSYQDNILTLAGNSLKYLKSRYNI